MLLNLETGVIEKEFHHYVRPTENPILSEYCINLTGITQNMVEEAGGAILVEDCIREFVLWIKQTIREYSLILPKTKRSNIDGNVVLVSWSNWDFCICLTKECGRKKIRKPSFFNQFMDLKEIFMVKSVK